MKIDLVKEDGRERGVPATYLSWLLWECMSMERRGENDFFTKTGMDSTKWAEKKKDLDVRLTIEGVEVPVTEVIQRLFDQHEMTVKKLAQEMVQEKIGGLMSDLENRMQDINRYIRGKLGLPEEDDYEAMPDV